MFVDFIEDEWESNCDMSEDILLVKTKANKKMHPQENQYLEQEHNWAPLDYNKKA